jgi:hypothetical protein
MHHIAPQALIALLLSMPLLVAVVELVVVVGKFRDCGHVTHLNDAANGSILFAKLWRDFGVVGMRHHAQQVMVNQHLSAGLRVRGSRVGLGPKPDTSQRSLMQVHNF